MILLLRILVCEMMPFADDTKPYKVIRSIHDRVVLQLSFTTLCACARQRFLVLPFENLYLQLRYSEESISYNAR